MMRNPRTTQERRENQDGKWCRARRSTNLLVDAWDDIQVGRRGRGWKSRKRRRQYESGRAKACGRHGCKR